MKRLTLYTGSSEIDMAVRQILEGWSANHPHIQLEYESIHANPAAVVRLGITHLPALAIGDELIVQGMPDEWLLPLLDRLFTGSDPHS
jgi:hypothetical protein